MQEKEIKTHIFNFRVVKLLDWFEEQDCFILVMEKPDNSTDLFDYISERGFLREETAKEIFNKVGDSNNITLLRFCVFRQSKQFSLVMREGLSIEISRMKTSSLTGTLWRSS